jgi:hypothetical protein
MLKYATKPRADGDLRVAHEQLAKMGMPDAETFELAVATRFAQTCIYAASELALFATNTPLFTLSQFFYFVDTGRSVSGIYCGIIMAYRNMK